MQKTGFRWEDVTVDNITVDDLDRVFRICDECQGIGAEVPVYELTGTTLRLRFQALESTLIDQPKTPNRQSGGLSGGLAERIIDLIRSNNIITVLELSEALETPKRTVEREMKKLRDSKRIKREGGNRYGL